MNCVTGQLRQKLVIICWLMSKVHIRAYEQQFFILVTDPRLETPAHQRGDAIAAPVHD